MFKIPGADQLVYPAYALLLAGLIFLKDDTAGIAPGAAALCSAFGTDGVRHFLLRVLFKSRGYPGAINHDGQVDHSGRKTVFKKDTNKLLSGPINFGKKGAGEKSIIIAKKSRTKRIFLKNNSLPLRLLSSCVPLVRRLTCNNSSQDMQVSEKTLMCGCS
jgi:hypothetical protein